MLAAFRSNKWLQRAACLLIGIGVGYLLERGGVMRYEVVIGQLTLQDFTIVKIAVTAFLTGIIGLYTLRAAGIITSKEPVPVGWTVLGWIIFGMGLGLLGH
jgi:uncharacterized protein